MITALRNVSRPAGGVARARCATASTSLPRHTAVRPRAAQLERQTEQTEEERVAEVRANVTRRVKALGEAGRPKDAIRELAGMAQLGIQPDAQAATALVAACVASRQLELAKNVFHELFDDFLQPDEVTFAVLVRGYGAATPPDWVAIDAALTTMRATYGITPTAVIFNALLEVCVRTRDVDRGQDVVDRMEAEGVEPDELTPGIVAPRRVLRSYLRKKFF